MISLLILQGWANSSNMGLVMASGIIKTNLYTWPYNVDRVGFSEGCYRVVWLFSIRCKPSSNLGMSAT
jgi:hypothetical protein